MRILQINSVYGYGSTGRIVQNLHKEIQANGHESYVIYGRGDRSKDKNVFKIGNKFEQAIDLLGTRVFNKHAQYNYENTKKIIKKIKEIKPDIVHLHNIHGYYVNFIKLISFLKSINVKIVWLLHDTWLISGSSADQGGIEYDWEKEPNLNHLKKISVEYPRHIQNSVKQGHKNYLIKKELLSNSGITFVTPSNWLAEIIKNSFLKDNNVITIHNGIDTEQFRVLDTFKRSKKKDILGVASIWEERKGLVYFNQLANDLDDSYSITVVGITKEQAKKLNKKIQCIQRTNSIQELVEIYNKSDIFVNPTMYDNFPTVNIEAQACGTPVITFNTGGSGESVIDGVTGKIIPSGDYNYLLKEIIAYPLRTDEKSKVIRENALLYSNSTMINAYVNLYLKLLN
ncbi:glycosyltransferase [Aerococcus viridans]|uniref:glycosyltransferase n=1 Tax=Aerococcus viridans TaxID=1377 RepID=UPI0003195B38|nr:glycosyltransferase [Aerococcus viridans]